MPSTIAWRRLKSQQTKQCRLNNQSKKRLNVKSLECNEVFADISSETLQTSARKQIEESKKTLEKYESIRKRKLIAELDEEKEKEEKGKRAHTDACILMNRLAVELKVAEPATPRNTPIHYALPARSTAISHSSSVACDAPIAEAIKVGCMKQEPSCLYRFKQTAEIEALQVKLPSESLAEDAIKSGLVIYSGRLNFETDAASSDPCLKYSYWQQLAKCVTCKSKKDGRACNIDTGKSGLSALGSGTYNLVFEKKVSEFRMIQNRNSVYRISRPDHAMDGRSKLQRFEPACAEAFNSMFASLNGIGVKVYSIVSFVAESKPGHSPKFATISTLDRAKCDLHTTLQKCCSFRGGCKVAEKTMDLLFRASRCGVAFTDVKPQNLLEMFDGSILLSDCDPLFFIRDPTRSWESLFLLNLALFAAHVKNAMYGCSGKGFLNAVAPILQSLIRSRSEADSEWLFNVRCVNVDFDCDLVAGDSFGLQKLFAIMTTSYFYGYEVSPDSMSYRFAWDFAEQATLNAFWGHGNKQRSSNLATWPNWSHRPFLPLIVQLVSFAVT